MSKEPLANEILGLPPAERLRLMEQIWESLAVDPDSVPIPDWHRQELDRRLAEHNADAATVGTWDDVKSRLDASRRRQLKS